MQDDIDSLSRDSPLLSSIEIIWDDDDPPDVTNLPALETLRIYCIRDAYYGFMPAQSLILPSLTTLAIYGRTPLVDSPTHAVFPNLRVLSLQGADVDQCDVYHFIQRQSSLLEVNIRFAPYPQRNPARLGPLIELIEGTSVWKKTPTSSSSSSIDDPTIATAHTSTKETWADVGIEAFAFCRTPLLSGDDGGSSPDTRCPKYQVTALALQTTYMERMGHDIDPCSSLTCSLSVSSFCVEHLTFKLTENCHDDDSSLGATVVCFIFSDQAYYLLKLCFRFRTDSLL